MIDCSQATTRDGAVSNLRCASSNSTCHVVVIVFAAELTQMQQAARQGGIGCAWQILVGACHVEMGMVDSHDDRAATRSPSAEVLRALREQWTPQVIYDLQLYAEQRARMVRASGRPCPPPAQYARELVHDAHADVWCGVLVWDPSRCSLFIQLRAAIKSRTFTEIKNARRFMSLDVRSANDGGPDDDDHSDESIQVRDTGEGEVECVGPVVFPALLARVCAELRQTAYHDHDCLVIVRAWERGFIDRDEIMEITGLDPIDYKRARERLFYASTNLPAELRQLVQHYLRSAS